MAIDVQIGTVDGHFGIGRYIRIGFGYDIQHTQRGLRRIDPLLKELREKKLLEKSNLLRRRLIGETGDRRVLHAAFRDREDYRRCARLQSGRVPFQNPD